MDYLIPQFHDYLNEEGFLEVVEGTTGTDILNLVSGEIGLSALNKQTREASL